MNAEENIRTQFTMLLKQGSLPRSACGGSFLKTLQPLLDSGVVVEERAGAGRRLAVRYVSAAKAFFAQSYPDADVFEGASSRIVGVARYRDSKVSASDTPDIVTLRAWSNKALWREGHPVPTAQATRTHGVFSFVLTPSSHYQLRGLCGLVENPALLMAFETLRERTNVALAIYGGGRISGRALAWLAEQSAPDFQLVHFPDYDPVGLSEFVRLRKALGARVGLHLHADLPERFARFGNPELLRCPASQALLPKLRSAGVVEVNCVLDLIDRHNAGLEQEALLVSVMPESVSRA